MLQIINFTQKHSLCLKEYRGKKTKVKNSLNFFACDKRRCSMRVERLERRKDLVKTQYTEKDLEAELNLYLSDNFIQDLFLLDEISLEEYRKIRRENIKKFKPILSELLL